MIACLRLIAYHNYTLKLQAAFIWNGKRVCSFRSIIRVRRFVASHRRMRRQPADFQVLKKAPESTNNSTEIRNFTEQGSGILK